MLVIYGTDVPCFKEDDWEDAFGTGAFPAYADWEHADWSRPVAFLVDDTDETRDLPVREFAVDLRRKDAEPFQMSEELDYLAGDICLMRRARELLFRIRPHDGEVGGMVETAQWAFSEAYDRALAKAARMIIMEAYGKRGE